MKGIYKHTKNKLGQYPAILTSHLVNNPCIMISTLQIVRALVP